jgi:hypothetical protein
MKLKAAGRFSGFTGFMEPKLIIDRRFYDEQAGFLKNKRHFCKIEKNWNDDVKDYVLYGRGSC